MTGGSQRYVDAILAPLRAEGRLRLGAPVDKIRRGPDAVELVGPTGPEEFDQVVVATHSDQALGLLSDADRAEQEVLGAIGYQPNRATLHTDACLCPVPGGPGPAGTTTARPRSDRATLTYHLNQLQDIPSATPVLVTLNRDDAVDPATVIARMDYTHPILDPAAVAAQARRHEINGRPAHLVLRGLLGLRLPRGRGAQRRRGLPGARGRV